VFSRRGQLEDLAVCGDSQDRDRRASQEHLRKLRWSDSSEAMTTLVSPLEQPWAAFEKIRNAGIVSKRNESLPAGNVKHCTSFFYQDLSLSEAAE